MDKSKYIVRPEFRANKDNQNNNKFSEFFKDFVNTISNMVFGDKMILTFIVFSFILYISIVLMVKTFRF
jgi:hypothetical protein